MPPTKRPALGSQPPTGQPPTGHPLPPRASPAASVTLRSPGLARYASLRASPGSGPARHSSSNTASPPRRNSSGGSHETGRSDPKMWFDQSNRNPAAALDHSAMDVDPPFFQRESDSSNEDKPHPYRHGPAPLGLDATHSSSADDYRSVIDDLTVEIQKLKDELRRYKQKGPDMLRKDKLFEIKIHGLPMTKRRELESTLRDFAASLDDSPDAASSQRKKSRHANRDCLYLASGSVSKHASSSSGSNARPADSAYASMSTGANSSGPSLGRPLTGPSVRSSDQKVESYLRGIPEGLYPRHMAMTDRERKKLVVRRLEQLFTGKIGGRYARRSHGTLPPGEGVSAANTEDQPSGQQVHRPPAMAAAEPAREARILPPDQQSKPPGKKHGSRDNGSAPNSNGDRTESGGGNGNSSGSGAVMSPSDMASAAEQRPTRLQDLDPDRVQVPSENMDYIRHLGLVPPELLADATQAAPDVHPDSEGWVYLNLLCNLAQLHMVNVTPSFVRLAVSEISTKFQLSPDGNRIRWRGGSEGTRFSSDSSGDNSQRSPDTDDTTSSGKAGSRKRQKTGKSTGHGFAPGSSSKNPPKLGLHMSASSESFHYKPLFVRQESPSGQTSVDDAMSSFGPVEESNLGGSRWGLSGSGASNRRKRRYDGAIIYYNGAPFCADLSGDPGDVSPATYMLSSGKDQQEPPSQATRPLPRPSGSGSSLCCRPLSDGYVARAGSTTAVVSGTPPGLTTDSGDDRGDVDLDLSWSGEEQFTRIHPLEPCGLGGVMPDDHFMVAVVTKRPREEPKRHPPSGRVHMDEAPDGIIGRLAAMSTSPVPPMPPSSSRGGSPAGEIEYALARIKRLPPVPLPPPVTFFPPFSTGSSSDADTHMGSDDDDDDDESASLEGFKSGRASPHRSHGYSDGADLSSGDEDGEDPDDEPDSRRMYDVGSCDRGDEHGLQSICSAGDGAGTEKEREREVSPRGRELCGHGWGRRERIQQR